MRIFPLFVLLSASLFSHQSISFEENKGHADAQVRYLARTRQATVFVTDTETVFSLRGTTAGRAAVRMRLVNGGGAPWVGEQRGNLTVSSYIGPAKNWRSEIVTYNRLRRKDVYRGIDLVFYGNGRELEYDFELQPGASADPIRMAFSGGKGVRVAASGDLEIDTDAGVLIHRRPIVKQGERIIPARFRRTGNDEFGIWLGEHDPTLPLTIDPVVSFTRFYGGEGDDVFTAISGASVAGYTNSIEFPGSTEQPAGGYDAFMITYGDSTRLVYIGGSGDDKAWAVWAGTGSGGAPSYAIAGETNSRDFPVVARTATSPIEPPASYGARPAQAKYGGGKSDGFFLWISNVFGPLGMQSSYIGGSGEDRVLGISGTSLTLALVGETDSQDFPVSANAFQPRLAGGKDGFYTQLRSQDTRIYGTYYGGTGNDRLTQVNLNVAAGVTDSDDFPLAGAFQAQRGGGQDAVILLVDIFNGDFRPSFSTYFGGSGDDQIHALRFAQRWLAVGTTTSKDLPGADPSTFGGESDAFVTEFNLPRTGDSGSVTKTTFFGGTGADSFRDAFVAGGDLFLAGTTNSKDLPLREPLQATYGGGDSDALLAVYTREGAFAFSSYFGGSGRDEGVGVGVDTRGGWLIAGNSNSPALPGAAGSSGPLNAGGTDGFLMQFSPPVLTISANHGVKDAATFGSIGAAILPSRRARLRIASADPSRLLLALPYEMNPRESIELDWNGASLSFQILALTDNGTAEIIATADGIGERRLTIPLFAPQVRVEISGPSIQSGAEVHVGSDYRFFPITVRASVVAPLPGSSGLGLVTYPRPGLPAQTLEFFSSNPRVLRLTRSTMPLSAYVSNNPSYNALSDGTGTTEITARVSGTLGTLDSAPVRFVRDEPQLAMFVSGVAAGVITSGSVSASNGTRPVLVKLTSLDPASALLANQPTDTPSESIILANNGSVGGSFYIAGIREGSLARFRASAEGMEDVILEVPVGRPLYRLTIGSTLRTGSNYTGQVTVSLLNRQSGTYNDVVAVWKPVSFRMNSSVPEVLAIKPEVVTIPTGKGSADFSMEALTAGVTVVRASGADGVDPQPASEAATVTVEYSPETQPLKVSAMTIGKDLQVHLDYQISSTYSGAITVTSSDPSKVLVTDDATKQGTGSLTGTRNTSFWVQALDSSGTATVRIIAGPNSAEGTVELVPSYAAVNPSGEYTTTVLTAVNFSIGTFADKGPSLSATLQDLRNPQSFLIQYANRVPQNVRGGIAAPQFTVETSNPDIGSIQQVSSPGAIRGYRFVPRDTGDVTLTIRASGAFTLNPKSRTLRISVSPVPLILSGSIGSIPKDAQRIWSTYTLSSALPELGLLTATSSDPGKVTVSSRMDVAGGVSADFRNPLYVQAQSDEGTASVQITGRATTDGVLNLSFVPSAITFGAQTGQELTRGSANASTPIALNVGGDATRLQFGLTDVAGLTGGLESPRPGVNPALELEVSPPGALRLSTARTSLGAVEPVTVTALLPGAAVIRVTSPDGYPLLPNAREIPFNVQLPPLTGLAPVINLTKDFRAMVSVTAQNTAITLTSKDPERLLLSLPLETRPDQPATTGQPSITLPAGRQSFFLIATGEGEVTLEGSAEGFRTLQTNVRIGPLRLAFSAPQQISLRDLYATATLSLFQMPAVPGESTPDQQYRPDGPRILLRVESDRTDVLEAEIGNPDRPIGTVQLRPRGAGTARLRVVAPQGVNVTPDSTSVTVFRPPIVLDSMPKTIGKNVSSPAFINTGGADVTLRSADPSRLAFALTDTDSPSGSVTLRNTNRVYVVGLETGTVEFVAEAEGFEPTAGIMKIWPTGFTTSPITSSLQIGSPGYGNIQLCLLDPVSGNIDSCGRTLRSGLRVLVPLVSSNPAVADTNPSSILFGASTSDQFQIVAKQPGTATISVEAPSGFAKPRTNTQITVTVKGQSLSITAPAMLGSLLRNGAVVYFPATLSTGITVTARSSDPRRILLSTTGTTTPSESITFPVAAGTRAGQFLIHGVTEEGSATITVSAPGYGDATTTVQLVPSAFAIVPPYLSGTASQFLPVTLTVAPLTGSEYDRYGNWRVSQLAGLSQLAGTLRLTITSDNPAVARGGYIEAKGASEAPSLLAVLVTFPAAGSTTIRLVQPPGFRAPSDPALSAIPVTVR